MAFAWVLVPFLLRKAVTFANSNHKKEGHTANITLQPVPPELKVAYEHSKVSPFSHLVGD